MDDNQTAVAIVAIVFLSPVIAIVLLRLLRGGISKSPNPQDQAQTEALMATAQRMERRIDSLEMLLDSELPGWRSRSRNP
jgi:phage shock protein B